MSTNTPASSRATFGLFEIDLKSGELWRSGFRVKLQSQPFKLLAILVQRAGEVVTREELQFHIWGPDTTVEFEQSLGSAVKKVREALGDSAVNPRYIETLSRRGYRFIAPVHLAEPPSPAAIAAEAVAHESAAQAEEPAVFQAKTNFWSRLRAKSALWMITLAFASGACLAIAVLRLWHPRQTEQLIPRIEQITQDGQIYAPEEFTIETLPGSFSDGVYIYTSSLENGHVHLSRVSIATGESQALPSPSQVAAPEISALSPDGSRLLIRNHLTAVSQQPLWVLRAENSSAFRVPNVLAHDATWMPDGQDILISSGDRLSVVSPETGKERPFATIPGRAFWLRWSPDGQILRFTLIDPSHHTASLWEIRNGESSAHPLLQNAMPSANKCCGIWTADGRQFIFQASQNGHTDLWRLNQVSNSPFNSSPIQMTNGPLDNDAPAASRNGEEVFFVGHDLQSKLEVFDRAKQQFIPYKSFFSMARRVRYSRDGKWLAWTDVSGHLWRARADGTESMRLTPDLMDVFLAAWSPDGSYLALMARYPGGPWQLYTVNADGGSPKPLLHDDRNVGDPSFSPDGRSLVFGRVPELMGQERPRPLQTLDLATNKVQDIPGSEGLFSPRWSPDGHYIAALTLDQQKVMLYDKAKRSWVTLAVTSAADPMWSTDSKSLFIHAFMEESRPIYRLSVPAGKAEQVGSLQTFVAGNPTQYFFSGLTPDNLPLVSVERFSGNLYALDLGIHQPGNSF